MKSPFTDDTITAPFPWFGGKRRVAKRVWTALGTVQNYVEPFAGALGVLLGRPGWNGQVPSWMETVNDADAYLCNFWRALMHAPAKLARLCEWPVNETDLFARHLWLVNEGQRRIMRLETDPDYFDVKVAAWWVWGLCAWIGDGWCYGNGGAYHANAEIGVHRKLPCLGDAGKGINRQRPHLSDTGMGVHRQLPHLSDAGKGVHRKLPHLSDTGMGVHRKRPHLGHSGTGVPWFSSGHLMEYFHALAIRLTRVRVCCGDWSRVVTHGALDYGSTVGIFLDPPYSGALRAAKLYRIDDPHISLTVRNWAIANGDNPRYRIVLAGFWSEHGADMPSTWRGERYTRGASYQGSGGHKRGNSLHRFDEALWYSPHCQAELATQQTLQLS